MDTNPSSPRLNEAFFVDTANTEPVVPGFVLEEGAGPEALLPHERKTVVRVADEMITEAQRGLEWLKRAGEWENVLDVLDVDAVRQSLVETIDVVSRYKTAHEKLYQLLIGLESGEFWQQLKGRETAEYRSGWRIRLAELETEVRAAFPTECADVRLGRNKQWATLGEDIPSVQQWQRLTNKQAKEADSWYMRYMQEARQHVLAALRRLKDEDDTDVLPNEDEEMETAAVKDEFRRNGRDAHVVFVNNIVLAQQKFLPYDIPCEGKSAMLSFLHPDMLLHLRSHIDAVENVMPGEGVPLWLALIEKTISVSRDDLRSVGARAADEACREVMEEALELLRERLLTAKIKPEGVSVKGLTGVAKKRRLKPTGQQQGGTAEQIQEHDALNIIEIPHEVARWLEGEDGTERRVYSTVTGVNGSVLVVDCQTEALRDVANSSSYDKGLVADKLDMIARQIATSRDGGLKGLKRASGRRQDEFNYPVMYWSNKTPNATRVYVAQIPVSALKERTPELHELLEDRGVHSLLAHIGTCDKKMQPKLLAQITAQSERSLIHGGHAGSV